MSTINICQICNYLSDNDHNFARHKCRNKTSFQCGFCKKYYKTKLSLETHINKVCKKNIKEIKTELDKDKKIEELTAKLALQDKQLHNINITNNITNNNITIVLLPHNKPDISYLTDADYYNILGRNLNSIPTIIEKLHFNANNPQNHNIYISNIKNKYAMLYNGSEWSLQNRDTAIHNLIIDNETRLEDWLTKEDILEKYPTAMKRFETYLSLKEKDENLAKIKEDILLLLYNKRDFFKKT